MPQHRPRPPLESRPGADDALHARLALAVRAVQKVLSGQSLNAVLAATAPASRPALQAMSFAVLRHLGTARAVLSLVVDKAPSPPIQSLLQVSLALHIDGQQYDTHTLVNQTVECARRHLGPKGVAAAGFINAVLRRVLRDQDTLLPQALALDGGPSRWNLPDWWLRRLQQDWPDQAQALAESAHRPGPMVLRVHPPASASHYVQTLKEAGRPAQLWADAAAATATPAPGAVWVDPPCAVHDLPGFDQGQASVQDASAQLAAPWLLGSADGPLPPLPPGARVLDACAAPGGKTAHLWQLRPDLHITALDQDAKRLAKVQDTLGRIGAQNHVHTQVADASAVDSWWDGQAFDAILLDAPCSASGIVRRHPDIAWLRRDSDIDALAATQSRLLDALWPLLKPGGRLLYATCSVFAAEGRDQAHAFVHRHTDAQPHPLPLRQGHVLPCSADGRPTGDGFFYALYTRSPAAKGGPSPATRALRVGLLAACVLSGAAGALLTPAPVQAQTEGSGIAAAGATANPSAAGAGAARPGRPRLDTLDLVRSADGLSLNFICAYELPAPVADALRKGTALHFVAQARIKRERWYWRDRTLLAAEKTWRLSYQPLTGKYRVSFGGLNQHYSSLPEALRSVSRAIDWRLAEGDPSVAAWTQDDDLYLEFEYRLDTSLLPRPMQMGIAGDNNWQIELERRLQVH